jgi:hypothetical protein
MAATINKFVGFETGGGEELDSFGSGYSVDTEGLGQGLYSLRTNTSSNDCEILPFSFVADAGNGYFLSFYLKVIDWSTTTTGVVRVQEGGSTDTVYFKIDGTSDNDLVLADANNSQLDRITGLSLNTVYHIEIYFEHSASAAWEWWLDGVSQGSGTAADITNGGTFDTIVLRSGTNKDWKIDNFVVRSGCAQTDRLGTGHGVLALATPLGTPTESGDTLDSGAMTDTQTIPLSASGASFTGASSAKSRWIQSDGDANLLGYFDASDDAVTDTQAVWTNDASAFNGVLANFASIQTTGSKSNNALFAGGATVAGNGDETITGVRARLVGGRLGSGDESASMSGEIVTDGDAETLGTPTITTTSGTEDYGSWTTLSAPTGGWTWAKIYALEVYLWCTSISATTGRIYRVDLAVAVSDYQTPADYGCTNIVASKLIVAS